MTAPSRPSAQPAPWFRKYAWGVLIYHLAVILWGAFVRATGSGAGCGQHWPLCNGIALPHSPSVATLIEFSHRVTSGLALTSVLLLVFFAFRYFPKRHLVRWAATATIVFELTEALIGAALVLLGQVARNTSTGRGYTLSAHQVNTLLLLAALTTVAWAAGRPQLRFRPNTGRLNFAFAICAASILLLSVSGAIAALGDTLFRVNTFTAGFAQDFAPGSHPFLRLRAWHPVIAITVAAALCLLSFRMIRYKASQRSARAAYAVIGLLILQLFVGLLNLALLAPIVLQIVHLLLADLLWIAFVLLALESLVKDFTEVTRDTAAHRDFFTARVPV